MPTRNENRVSQLSLAVASGMSVARWSKENSVPLRTCYTWSSTPEFKERVAEHRRRMVDRTIGRLTNHAARAVADIARLMKSRDSDAVRLSAARGLLQELLAVSSWSDLDRRLAEVEKRLAERGDDEP